MKMKCLYVVSLSFQIETHASCTSLVLFAWSEAASSPVLNSSFSMTVLVTSEWPVPDILVRGPLTGGAGAELLGAGGGGGAAVGLATPGGGGGAQLGLLTLRRAGE